MQFADQIPRREDAGRTHARWESICIPLSLMVLKELLAEPRSLLSNQLEAQVLYLFESELHEGRAISNPSLLYPIRTPVMDWDDQMKLTLN